MFGGDETGAGEGTEMSRQSMLWGQSEIKSSR